MVKDMKITFIAHAGISIEEAGHEILIDPWFTDSSLQSPILKSLFGHATIDFQIPKTDDTPQNHTPGAILVSHFHTHHAPHDDIVTLVSQTDAVLFGHPDLGENNDHIQTLFVAWPQARVRAFSDGDRETNGPFSIRGMTHTVPKHTAWFVSTGEASMLHIADPVLNRDNAVRLRDTVWDRFSKLAPDVLFISAGGNSFRREKDGKRSIVESATLSPVEAAKVTARIHPRAVSLIGCYNHSVWRNRQEYIPPSHQIEDEFYWALSWLAPSVKFVPLKPGHTFGIGDVPQCGLVDTYLA
jgi:L-ascorbate metabolism protein UlaG (beta-lactamase superfamily)